MNNKTTAFVFPGQGSQKVAMLADIISEFSLVGELFVKASEILGYDLLSLINDDPDKLNETIYTQPAMFVADIAMWQLWLALGGDKPQLVAGHSLGEYVALVVAGAIDFVDGLKLVNKRAHFMQQAVPIGVGAMAAIVLLSLDVVEEICQEVAGNDILSIANINEDKQVVIAGHTKAVDRAVVLAIEKGARLAKRLPLSIPSHCLLMKPVADQLATYLGSVSIQAPNLVFINNVDVAIYTDPEGIRDALVRQLYSPVRWLETIRKMVTQGIETIVECGPGKTLTGQNRRIAPNLEALSFNSLTQVEYFQGQGVLKKIDV